MKTLKEFRALQEAPAGFSLDRSDAQELIGNLQKAAKLVDKTGNPSVSKLSDDWERDSDDEILISPHGDVYISTDVYNNRTGRDKRITHKV